MKIFLLIVCLGGLIRLDVYAGKQIVEEKEEEKTSYFQEVESLVHKTFNVLQEKQNVGTANLKILCDINKRYSEEMMTMLDADVFIPAPFKIVKEDLKNNCISIAACARYLRSTMKCFDFTQKSRKTEHAFKELASELWEQNDSFWNSPQGFQFVKQNVFPNPL